MRPDSSIYDSHNYTMITVDLCSILLLFPLIIYTFLSVVSRFIHLLHIYFPRVCGTVPAEEENVIETILREKKVKHITTSKWWCWKFAVVRHTERWRVYDFCDCSCCWWWTHETETKCTTLSAASIALNIFHVAAVGSLDFVAVVSFRIFCTVDWHRRLSKSDHFHIQFLLNLFCRAFSVISFHFYGIAIALCSKQWMKLIRKLHKNAAVFCSKRNAEWKLIVFLLFGLKIEGKQVAHIIPKSKNRVQ